MDYLQTTGDRLHDLELDRILARLAALEARGAITATNTSSPLSSPLESALVVAVRTITPAGGTAMQDDLVLAVVGPVSLTQAAQTLTLTVSVAPATTVTDIGAVSAVGTAPTYAREDHVHAGVHKITGSADAQGNLVFTGVGVSQTGNTFTFSGGGSGPGVPTNVLIISPGGSAINWVVPAALTEFNASTRYRGQHDLTNATQARLILVFGAVALLLAPPTLAVQYSTNGGSSWSYLDGSTGPSATYGTTLVVSSWITLDTAARADVLLRLVASGGDGTTSVSFGSIYVQVK